MNRLETAQKKLVEDNLRLVPFVLKKMHVTRSFNCYDDLYGAGCVGLCMAAAKWRRGGEPFSTFAFHIIRFEIIRSIREAAANPTALSLDGCGIDIPESGQFEDVDAKLLTAEFLSFLADEPDGVGFEVTKCLRRGLSCRRTAKALGLSLSAVYKARRRTYDALKDFLANRQ